MKIIVLVGIASAALAAAGAAAQAPAPRPAPSSPAGPAMPTVPGVSPAGNAVIAKTMRQDDPATRDAITKLQALVPQLSQAAQAPTVDVEKFAALLHQQDMLTGQLKTRTTERLLAILRALPAPDRGPFLRAVGSKASRPAAGAAPR